MYTFLKRSWAISWRERLLFFSSFPPPCPQHLHVIVQLAFMAGPYTGYHDANSHSYDTYMLNYSQKPKVIEVGKDLPAQTMVNYSRLLRIMSSQVKQTSKDEEFKTSQRSLLRSLINLKVKRWFFFFLSDWMEHAVFQFVPAVLSFHWMLQNLDLSSLLASIVYLYTWIRSPVSLLFCRLNSPTQLSSFPWITSAPVLWPSMRPFAGFCLVCCCLSFPTPFPSGELPSEHGIPGVLNLMWFSLTNFFRMSRYLVVPCANPSCQFIICRLCEGALCPVIQVINGDVRQYLWRCWPLRLQHQCLASICA